MSESVHRPRLIRSDGQEFVVNGSLTVGRSSECSLQLEDNLVSRRHALLEVANQQVTVTDLDSHNGTWVNDQKITIPTILRNGDHLRIGKTIFVFKAPEAVLPAEVPIPSNVASAGSSKTVEWPTGEPLALVRSSDEAEFGLNRNLRIGRDEANDLVLKGNSSASQFHASIEWVAGQPVIIDQKSRNGVWVNGKRITMPTPLRHGDKIRLGDTVFRLRVGERPLPPLDEGTRTAGKAATVTCGLLSVGAIALIVVVAVLMIIGPWIGSTFSSINSSLAVVPVVTGPPYTPVSDSHQPVADGTPTAPTNPISKALRALVYVQVPDGSGSGSLLNAQGYVLTNFHVVQEGQTGRYYSQVTIGMNRSDPENTPNEFYLGDVVEADSMLDLAVLHITTRLNGESVGNETFDFVPIGDSDDLSMGDPISIIGFPSIGGATPTYSKGTVSGFLSSLPVEHDVLTPGWIKTDAVINPGNSGGMAINDKGELIGVPTLAIQGVKDPSQKIYAFRPVNMALDLIKSACPSCLP